MIKDPAHIETKDFERGPAGGVGGKSLEKSGKLLCLKIISRRVTRARNCLKEKNIAQQYPGKPKRKTDNSCVESSNKRFYF